MKQLKSWQHKVYVQSSAQLLLRKYPLRFGIWPPRLLAKCKTIYHWSEALCQMDKPLQTELRLSDVSHFCLCLAKSCGWDLVKGLVNGKWNMESVAGTQGAACNARASARADSCAGLRHGTCSTCNTFCTPTYLTPN